MKKLISLLLASSISLAAWSQNQYTVNNNSNFAADFSNLQTAVDSVPSGSILIVQGSGISYGNIVVNKPLVLLGPGYNLVSNPEIYGQNDHLDASLNLVRFRPSSSGSIISGFNIQNTLTADTCNNLVVTGNRCDKGIYLDNSGSVTINQNFIFSWRVDVYGSAGTVIKNNIFYIPLQANLCIAMTYNTGSIAAPSVIAENNIFLRNDSTTIEANYSNVFSLYTLGTPISMTVRNNTFANLSNSPNVNDFRVTATTNATVNWQNNIFTDSSQMSSTGAINNVSPTALFAHLNNTAYAMDYKLQNAAGSPAIGAGTGGSTIGAYGGTTPYILSGHVLIPNIYKLEVPLAGSNANGLDIKIKAKAN